MRSCFEYSQIAEFDLWSTNRTKRDPFIDSDWTADTISVKQKSLMQHVRSNECVEINLFGSVTWPGSFVQTDVTNAVQLFRKLSHRFPIIKFRFSKSRVATILTVSEYLIYNIAHIVVWGVWVGLATRHIQAYYPILFRFNPISWFETIYINWSYR